MMEIHLNWRGPYSLEDASGGLGETLGLYQYIGMNAIYGPAALLYLGRASRRHIGIRLAEHNLDLWSSLPVEILIGEIAAEAETPLDENERMNQIELAESLLIYTHSPAWNSSNIQNVNWSNMPDLHIFNWGVRGHLLPEVSTKRWREVGNALPERLEIQG